MPAANAAKTPLPASNSNMPSNNSVVQSNNSASNHIWTVEEEHHLLKLKLAEVNKKRQLWAERRRKQGKMQTNEVSSSFCCKQELCKMPTEAVCTACSPSITYGQRV